MLDCPEQIQTSPTNTSESCFVCDPLFTLTWNGPPASGVLIDVRQLPFSLAVAWKVFCVHEGDTVTLDPGLAIPQIAASHSR